MVQIWNTYPAQRQVMYWTRTAFSKRHVEYLNRTRPKWDDRGLNPRKPLGPYLVDCSTKKINVVLFKKGWSAPVLDPVGEDLPVGGHVCRLAGFRESD